MENQKKSLSVGKFLLYELGLLSGLLAGTWYIWGAWASFGTGAAFLFVIAMTTLFCEIYYRAWEIVLTSTAAYLMMAAGLLILVNKPSGLDPSVAGMAILSALTFIATAIHQVRKQPLRWQAPLI